MNDAATPLGPLFSADRIFVTVAGTDKVSYQLEIFPDANNALLKSNGMAQQYYFMPQRIYLAKKQDSPAGLRLWHDRIQRSCDAGGYGWR